MNFTKTARRLGLAFLLMASAAPCLSWALSPGDPVPDFQASNQDGKRVKLSDFAGKAVLLYFYPKDDTPGCTQEACTFRDEFAKFKQRGAVVLGVSRQSAETHRQFRKKHRLPFDLLVDENGDLAQSLGVGTMPVLGLHKRQSLLISADGRLIRFFEDVIPGSHAREVLSELDAFLARQAREGVKK